MASAPPAAKNTPVPKSSQENRAPAATTRDDMPVDDVVGVVCGQRGFEAYECGGDPE